MERARILVVGGGIGGLTSAIALRRNGFDVEVIEKDPDWSVYGVGIIQQANVVRAMADLDILDDFIDAAFGFDHVEVFIPSGQRVAKLPAPRLVEGYPANVGIGRPALHKVLGDKAKAAGATIRLGVTIDRLEDTGETVQVRFSDGTDAAYDIVIGADGLYSATRQMLFPEYHGPRFTGQSVWRYNFPRDPEIVSLCAFEGAIGVGLVPLSRETMYMYVTTPEPGNPRYPQAGLAAAMRDKLVGSCARIAALAEQITDDDAVVYKPLDWHFVEGAWSRGRVVLVGDAVHGTTPHLGQGAGMAVEDSIVLAEELARHDTPEAAFAAYRARRFERCRYIVDSSVAICRGQIGEGPLVETGKASHDMFLKIAEPI